MVLECLSERLSRRFFCTLRPIRHKGPRFSCILSGWVLSAAARCAVSLFWALSMWLFHLYSILKIQSFPQVLGDPRIRHFAGYPFGSSRKKVSTIFYNTAFLFDSPTAPFSLSITTARKHSNAVCKHSHHVPLCALFHVTIF